MMSRGCEKLPSKRRVIRRINFMTTDNGTLCAPSFLPLSYPYHPHPSSCPSLSLLVQDQRMLINKLPAIQLSSNLNMALAVLRNVLKQQQQQQQVPLPNVDLFSCCPSVCVCPEAHSTCTCRLCHCYCQNHFPSLLPPFNTSAPTFSRQLSLGARVASRLITKLMAKRKACQVQRSGSKGISSVREKEIKTLNGLTIKYAAKRVTIWRSYRHERLPINLILLRI